MAAADKDINDWTRRQRAIHAVELHAYYGKAAYDLTDDQVRAWLDLAGRGLRIGGDIRVRVVNKDVLRRANTSLVG